MALALAVTATAATGCKFPYPPDVTDDDAAAACTPSTTTCVDDTLIVCDHEGHPSSSTACTFGCAASGDRCGDLAPSNRLGVYLDQARTASPLTLSGQAVIDTDTARVTVNGDVVAVPTAVVPAVPVEILVIVAKSFEADNIISRGRRGLAIVADGDVILHGTLSASATTGTPGPGAASASDPACTAAPPGLGTTGTGGAGGGGHGSVGGRGGRGGDGAGGQGGAVAGNEPITPLRGGCPGAYAYGTPDPGPAGGRPGAGGGAIQISTRGRLVLGAGAKITASGGGARGPVVCDPFCPFCATPAGETPACDPGSGGGAGGGILLEAAVIEVPATAAITANGGAGHCGSSGTSADGGASEDVAPGTVCAGVPGIGNGGNGGAGTVSGSNGSDTPPTVAVAAVVWAASVSTLAPRPPSIRVRRSSHPHPRGRVPQIAESPESPRSRPSRAPASAYSSA